MKFAPVLPGASLWGINSDNLSKNPGLLIKNGAASLKDLAGFREEVEAGQVCPGNQPDILECSVDPEIDYDLQVVGSQVPPAAAVTN